MSTFCLQNIESTTMDYCWYCIEQYQHSWRDKELKLERPEIDFIIFQEKCWHLTAINYTKRLWYRKKLTHNIKFICSNCTNKNLSISINDQWLIRKKGSILKVDPNLWQNKADKQRLFEKIPICFVAQNVERVNFRKILPAR